MKTVLITGATSGFGEAAAKRFVNEGWRVIGTGRREERLAKLKDALGENFFPLAFDISDKESMNNALATLPEEFSDITTLVNNAGLALGLGSLEDGSEDDWETMIDTNIKGLLFITKAMLTKFVARGEGHVINIGSVAGTYAYPGGNVYGGTKAFVNHFTQHLRADMISKNVRTTSIEPGLCDTEFSTVRFKGDVDKADSTYTGMKALSADDVAESIFWCANLPSHMNISRLELVPVQQGCAPFAIDRSGA